MSTAQRFATFGASLLCWMLSVGAVVMAQGEVEQPLFERGPFDRITLDAANNNAIVEVFPLTDIDRSRPVLGGNRSLFTIRRLEDPPDRLFRVSRRNIVKFELFHELLLAKSRAMVAEQDVDGAFPYLARLVNDFPDTPGLELVLEEFYFADARHLFERERYDEALVSLEQVYARNPQRPGLDRVLRRVAGEILQIEYDAQDYDSVRRKLAYVDAKFRDVTDALKSTWEGRLQADADKQLARAQRAFDSGDAISALAASRQALRIWPTSEPATVLRRAILAKYPRVRVGVTQGYRPPAEGDVPPPRILSWSERRAAQLIRRHVVEFEAFTAEGGQYRSPIGQLTVGERRQSLTISLASGSGGYDLCRSLLRVADPADVAYSARWAEFLSDLFLVHAGVVEVRLTRPALRPAALLPRSLPLSTELAEALAGAFEPETGGDDDEQHYRLRVGGDSENTGVTQIVERRFEDPDALTEALVKGEIDVIDRVLPRDVPRLQSQPEIRVVAYQTPSVHFLVFNDREPLLRSSTFRRGLLYGINRAQFVEQMAGGAVMQVLSAPIPAGRSVEDPQGYAYDRTVIPRTYDPALSAVLLRLARMQQEINANTANTTANTAEPEQTPPATEPEGIPPLVLACVDGPVARAACAAITFDLRRIGVPTEVRVLPPATVRPPDNDWDLLYVEACIDEPLIDFPELVLGESILGRHGGLVWQATRTLQDATDLAQARMQFARIHKLAFDHTPAIPLWQMIEHAAYRSDVQGIPEQPVRLYDNISNWQFTP